MRSRVTNYRAVLFDLDGTLVRTFIDFPAIRRAVAAVANEFDVSSALNGLTDSLAMVDGIAAAVGADHAGRARAAAYERIVALEREGCANAAPVAGATALLRRLRSSGVGVAIVTRNSREIAAELLRTMDLPHDVLIAREDVREFKPHPAPILRACEDLDVAPEHAVMVGDLWTDIAAARAAGVLETIGIHWAYDPPDRFAACMPDVVATSLEAVAERLLSR
jgi:phosphoglycolate phosphatase